MSSRSCLFCNQLQCCCTCNNTDYITHSHNRERRDRHSHHRHDHDRDNNRPVFLSVDQAAIQQLVSNVESTVLFGTTHAMSRHRRFSNLIHSGSTFNNGVFTVPYDGEGYYHLSANITINAPVENTIATLSIKQNGVPICSGIMTKSSNDSVSGSLSMDRILGCGNTISIGITCNQDATIQIAPYTNAGIHLVFSG